LPVRFVNNTGLSDAEVFITTLGNAATGSSASICVGWGDSFVFMALPSVGAAGGTYSPVMTTNPGVTAYSYPLSDFASDGDGQYIYMPPFNAGRMFISYTTPLSIETGSNSYQNPNPATATDANYNTIYDKMEFTFVPAGCGLNQIGLNVTAVDFFGLPIYLYLANPGDTPDSITSGVYQPRDCVIQNMTATFADAIGNASSQWNGLVQKPGATVLRVLSPEGSIANGGTFDPDYLDNAVEYGYSWANNVWSSLTAFYGTEAGNLFLIETTTYSALFQGQVSEFNGVYYFIFKPQEASTTTYTIPWNEQTGIDFLEANSPFTDMSTGTPTEGTAALPYPGPGQPPTQAFQDAVEITQLFEAAWVIGLVPQNFPGGGGATATLSRANIQTLEPYYRINPNLSQGGQDTGPWYNLYDKSIHVPSSMNNVTYAYAWDDVLYPVIGSGYETLAPTAYLGIVLGPAN
jgi:hypothetical protein